MIKILLFAIVGLSISQANAQSPAQQAEALNLKAKAAENAGDPTAARDFYASALKLDPKNATAIYSLGQLKIHSGSIAAKGREAKLGAVIIPNFQLDQATFKEALDALGKSIEKESQGTLTPNFVIQDPQNRLADQKLSVNLKNIPAKGVMQFLLEQTSTKARYDEHAVVVLAK
jgi:hypothetical protein